MDVVELSLPSSLSSWPSSTARITFRSPGAPGTDTHVIGHGGHGVVLLEERRRRRRTVPAVPARAFLGGAARQQLELRVVGAVERAAAVRCQAIASEHPPSPRARSWSRGPRRRAPLDPDDALEAFLASQAVAGRRADPPQRSDGVATSAINVGRNATTKRSTFLLPVRRAFMRPSSSAPVPPRLSPPPAMAKYYALYMLVCLCVLSACCCAVASYLGACKGSCYALCLRVSSAALAIVGFGNNQLCSPLEISPAPPTNQYARPVTPLWTIVEREY